MPCYHPLQGYRSRVRTKSGKLGITFSFRDAYVDMPVTVPCGRCIGCRLERSRQWAVRCLYENQLHSESCFVTLTYDPVHLPPGGTLDKRHFQLFMKRLRKAYPGRRIRYFHCGEYGSSLERPHYHAIIFGLDFEDRVLYKEERGVRVDISDSLARLWPFGFSTVGNVSFESAAYVARYIVKKINGDRSESHYNGRLPEYITMSRRPGIAHDWISRFKDDVYPDDLCVVRKGLIAKPPKYYDRIFDLTDHTLFCKIKAKRVSKAKGSDDNCLSRLAVREVVQKRRAEKLVRKFESGSV